MKKILSNIVMGMGLLYAILVTLKILTFDASTAYVAIACMICSMYADMSNIEPVQLTVDLGSLLKEDLMQEKTEDEDCGVAE